jgi:hypothetical protein
VTTGTASALFYISANYSYVYNNTVLAPNLQTNDVPIWVRAVAAGSKRARVIGNTVQGGGTGAHGAGIILVNGLTGTSNWSEEVTVLHNTVKGGYRGISVGANTFGTTTDWTQHSNTARDVILSEDDFGETVPPKRIAGSSASVSTFSGSGTPQSVVTAPIGSTYLRDDGGANTTFYVKESGTGNTGWIAK